MRKIIVTGALGQIGSGLIRALRKRHGREVVLASDVRAMPVGAEPGDGPFEHPDCTKLQQIQNAEPPKIADGAPGRSE
jgi:nucleoside-diphosphate-sugar epimerase